MKIKTLNARLKALKGYLSEDAYDKVLKGLNLPSTNLITESGYISTRKSKNFWGKYSPTELKALESKSLPTIKELIAESKNRLSDTGVIESYYDAYKEKKDTIKELEANGVFDKESSNVLLSEAKAEYNKNVRDMIRIEVSAKVIVEDEIDEAINEWYDWYKAIGIAHEDDADVGEEITQLNDWINSSGTKSYTELQAWIEDINRVITEVSG